MGRHAARQTFASPNLSTRLGLICGTTRGRVGGVVTEPLPPQIRTCAYSRIRFLT